MEKPQDADEIDLFELMSAVWKQKIIVVFLVMLSVLTAAAYAFLSKPIYEARIFLQPPTLNGIADFNYGRTRDAELTPFAVKDVYQVFVRNLQSESLRRAFFAEVYLPSLPESKRNGSQDVLYSDYLNELTIDLPTKDQPDRYSISVQSRDPVQATDWVKVFAARAGDAAESEMLKNVEREAEVRARNLGQQIATLQKTADKVREDSITQLREALKVAQAIHLKEPPIISGNVLAEVSATMNGQLTYMRGTQALEAEIKNLEERKSNDPFIDSLRALQIKQSFYKDLQVSHDRVSVYLLDGTVEQPDRPIKPKKGLIIALGVILGIALGVLVALIRHFVLIRKTNNTSDPLFRWIYPTRRVG
ncbi:Wzz/FepE/Etk N-terminal domain-containing protein [Pseudomonas sp. 10B1]|uniref:LPS O-antigen chain length determinant protein WzzB n=1 Tax=unclassified Pseudomonas TaxID=196821 RepID=UPI002B22F3FA|nr:MULTISPECIES: Wzz/FepE/Etk N-terminal domain-containing protein [unclassified Pseudomonas]MEA9994847.1 Wzz/FepE/Etk N-terminal domain-containing protein [Pseudomonas sp. AA4]MEB0088668.1 Wzz/FepE/Etk N-terminal domain-containing protein [Pseudomonas sp. RTI1]MEB0127207.1 Wzz/FepE/Etk N-terminal domain-containing protein [Pseudomonas sp. CCC1.2]MEB0155815.1 Wzz/FepE/Etk N-terminal domain-containing protein [Pseudomonas sp. CCC4.3]MEB0219488.1 Wzz/FepE/Etk N-terminal domain-containing protein